MESFTQGDLTRAAGPRRIEGVDALRAFAMTAVVAEHSRLFSVGWTGVWLFYVISGFVVTGALSSREGAGAARRLGEFWIRRCARIMPAYYAWVALAVAASLAQHLHPNPRAVASLVLFFNNFALGSGWGNIRGFDVGNLWTVSVEMQFYALYGLLFIFAPRRLTLAVLFGLFVACPMLRFLYGDSLEARGAAPLDAAYRVYSFSVLHFDAFAGGCLLSLFRHRLDARGARRLLLAASALLGVYVIAYASINAQLGAHGIARMKNLISGILYGQHRETFLYIPIDLLAVSLLWFVVTSDRLDLRLSHPALTHVGRVSYGAYLYHGVVLGLVGAIIGPWLPDAGWQRFISRGIVFALTLILVVGLATLSFRFVEQPVSRWVGRRLAKRSASDVTVGYA